LNRISHRILVLAIGFIFCGQLNGQFNVKIGYGMGFTNAKVNNSIVQSFNTNGVGPNGLIQFEEQLPDLGSVYGIILGARFKISESNSFELSWENLSKTRESFGIYESTQTLFENEISYSFNHFYIGYQSEFGNLGMGSAIGINRAKIKRSITGSTKKLSLVSDNQYFARFNLSYNLRSSRSVALSIQPFYQLPLSNISLLGLSDYLEVSTSDTAETFPMFGISLVFYNGRQK